MFRITRNNAAQANKNYSINDLWIKEKDNKILVFIQPELQQGQVSQQKEMAVVKKRAQFVLIKLSECLNESFNVQHYQRLIRYLWHFI